MWLVLAKVDWGAVGPIIAATAAFGGMLYQWADARQKRKAAERKAEHANGKAAGAFKLIDELQEQLKNEWDNKARLQQRIMTLEEAFDKAQDQIYRAREVIHENERLFSENAELKRRNETLIAESKKSTRKKRAASPSADAGR